MLTLVSQGPGRGGEGRRVAGSGGGLALYLLAWYHVNWLQQNLVSSTFLFQKTSNNGSFFFFVFFFLSEASCLGLKSISFGTTYTSILGGWIVPYIILGRLLDLSV